MNDEARTVFAASVAAEIAGKDKVDRDTPPLMGAEDFAYMLEERPGAFIYVGNGDSAMLHHPAYDFNDGRSRSAPPTGCGSPKPRSRGRGALEITTLDPSS